MAFVLMNKESQYLRRMNGRREWVAELDLATLWPKSGSAINAAHCANSDVRLTRGKPIGELRLQQVNLVAGPVVRNVMPKKVS